MRWVRTKIQECRSLKIGSLKIGFEQQVSDNHRVSRQETTLTRVFSEEPWLLVFDNADSADNRELLKDFWPETNQGSILITSRDQTLIRESGGVEIRKLETRSAIDLLLNLTKFNQARLSPERVDIEASAAAKSVRQIGYLPLVIGQAANLIISEPSSFTDFLEP